MADYGVRHLPEGGDEPEREGIVEHPLLLASLMRRREERGEESIIQHPLLVAALKRGREQQASESEQQASEGEQQASEEDFRSIARQVIEKVEDVKDSDTVAGLAYVAANQRLASQNSTLESMQSRAAGILSIATLIAAFASGVGLIRTSAEGGVVLPTWAAWTLFSILIFIGCCAVRILLPIKRWAYGASASIITSLGRTVSSVSALKRMVTADLLIAIDHNEGVLKAAARWYRGAAVGLLVEVLFLIAAIAATV